MRQEQIIVRAMLKDELMACQHDGKWHGHYMFVRPETVQNEIKRRQDNSKNNIYSMWGPYYGSI